jgi:hypothetical protein
VIEGFLFVAWFDFLHVMAACVSWLDSGGEASS